MSNEGDIAWKIRRKDGLYSTGGLCPKWSKRGKVWNSIGSLKNHLHLLDKRQRDLSTGFYAEAEVVCLRISVDEQVVSSVNLLISEQEEAKKLKDRYPDE